MDDFFDSPDAPLPDTKGEFVSPAEGAKFMASFGIPQIPLRGKRPFMTGWQDKGSTDFDQIDRWAQDYPGCNFGSIAKRSLDGFFALEVDSVDVRATFQRENPGQDFTAVLIVKSGDGRGHRWYRHSAETLDLSNIGQEDKAGFSLRLHNEQCCSSGSVHPERFTQYSVVPGSKTPQPPSPQEVAWFRSKKVQAEKIKKAKTEGGKRILIRHGAMYDALISQAGRLWNNGFPPAEIPDMLVSWAHENCEAPIDEHKVKSYAVGANWKQGEPGAEWVYSGAYEETPIDTEVLLPDFPRMPGLLSDLCDAVCPDIPYEFKFMSIATHWGLARSGMDTLDGETHVQPRFYTCLIKEPGYGKTAAMNEMRNFAKMLGVPYSMMSSVDSGPALVDEFVDVRSQAVLKGVGVEGVTSFPARVLLDTDEMSDLFEKSKVTAQGRNSLFTEFLKLYEGNRTGNRSRKAGKSQLDDAHLAILAGATPVSYERMWTGTGGGSSGLQSRFIPISTANGKMPVNKATSDATALARIIPLLIEVATKPGVKLQMTADARVRFAAWWGRDRNKTEESRVEDMVKRMLIIIAVTSGVDMINRDLIELGIQFGEYIIAAREKFNPNDSYSFTQAFEDDIRKAGQRHTDKSMTMRDFSRLIHPDRKPGGIGPFLQAWRNMVTVGELIPDGANLKGTVKFRFSKGE